MPRMKKGPKLVLFGLVAAGLFFGARWGMNQGFIPTPGFMKATEIATDANISDFRGTSSVGEVAALPLPGTDRANIGGPEFRAEVWAWNGQISCLYAIGGPNTTENSAMARHGVNASVRRQDDTEQMKADLIAYAREYNAGNRNPASGVNAVAIMGSQVGGFLQSVNSVLKELNDEAIVVYICGRSDGEDAVLGPPAWKQNPQAAKGGTVAVVPLEGDADLLKKWIKDNDLKFNPDESTYDPDAVNLIAASTYVDAADKYVAGYTEERPVVRAGRKTGETRRVTVDAVSTWTPADVKVAKGRGGLVRVVSTHEYSGIMPNTWIVLRRWAEDNRTTMVNTIKAFGEAGNQILGRPEALERACEISAQVYDEETPSFWCKYYRGVTEADRTGLQVQLGGSRAANLADNAVWFGLNPGSENIFGRTYTTFGNMLVELYPTVLKEFPPVEDILETSFVATAIQQSATSIAETQEFTEGVAGARVAKREWRINFRTGSAEFTPAAERELSEMLNDLVIAGNLAIEIQGHTDNTGTPEGNELLSEQRAFAVKQFLESKAPANFPSGRITVKAFGQSQPVETNSTEAGRSKNRRVAVLLREAQ